MKWIAALVVLAVIGWCRYQIARLQAEVALWQRVAKDAVTERDQLRHERVFGTPGERELQERQRQMAAEARAFAARRGAHLLPAPQLRAISSVPRQDADHSDGSGSS